MRFWSRKRIARGDNVPGKVARIAAALEREFAAYGADAPTLMRIGRHDSNRDEHRFSVDVLLAPGIALPMEYGLVETLGEEWDDPEDDEEGTVEDTMEGVNACMPLLAGLGDALHRARLNARATVAGWAAGGVTSRVIDVRLSPYDHWRGSTDPAVRVTLEGLDESLEPFATSRDTSDYYPLDKMLEEFRLDLAAAGESRNLLASQGATHSISQLALNAIADMGDTAATLRRFQGECRIRLPDDTDVASYRGEVDVGYGSLDDALQWRHNGLTVAAHLIAGCDTAIVVGRPVTELIDHHFLSRDMTVLSASWSEDEAGRRWLHVELAMPWKLFCSASGRVWDPNEAAPAGDNVVPFARRA